VSRNLKSKPQLLAEDQEGGNLRWEIKMWVSDSGKEKTDCLTGELGRGLGDCEVIDAK